MYARQHILKFRMHQYAEPRIPEKIMVWVNPLIESVLMILIAMEVLGFLSTLYIPMF